MVSDFDSPLFDSFEKLLLRLDVALLILEKLSCAGADHDRLRGTQAQALKPHTHTRQRTLNPKP